MSDFEITIKLTDINEARRVLDAHKYLRSLYDIDDYLRRRLKYDELSDEVFDALQKARSELWDSLKEHNIDIYND